MSEQDRISDQVANLYNQVPYATYDVDLFPIIKALGKTQDEFLLFAKDKHGLEVGSGGGHISSFLAGFFSSFTGVDISANSLELAKKEATNRNITNVNFILGNLFNPEFRAEHKEKYDFVLCYGVLHHTQNPEEGFRNLTELVKPGGIILVGVYSRTQWVYRVKRKIVLLLAGDSSQKRKTIANKLWFGGKGSDLLISDAYVHPQVSFHSIQQVYNWLKNNSLFYLGSWPPIEFGWYFRQVFKKPFKVTNNIFWFFLVELLWFIRSKSVMVSVAAQKPIKSSSNLFIFTEEYRLIGKIKYLVKKILGRNVRGPAGVANSLIRGLKELQEPFKVNKQHANGTAIVLSGVKVLKDLILAKQRGEIDKLIAGPNIVVSPDDADRIMHSPEIDNILVPSQWVKDFYAVVSPNLLDKVFIWPSGVEIPAEHTEKKYDFLIYNKLAKESIFSEIVNSLNSSGFSYQVIEYGKFQQKDYFALLNQSRFLIYLSRSESQGLAMFEAWARNIPTLVWEPGFVVSRGIRINGFTSSPYLTESLGLRFKDISEFNNQVSGLQLGNFSPREYTLNHYTDSYSAKKLLELIR